MMAAEVRVGACPRPVVLDGRERRRRDDLLNHHRMHRSNEDLSGGNLWHRYHQEAEDRRNQGCVDFHMVSPDLNTDARN